MRADAVGVAARARVDAGNAVDAMESFAVKLASSASFARRDDAARRRCEPERMRGFWGFSLDGD